MDEFVLESMAPIKTEKMIVNVAGSEILVHISVYSYLQTHTYTLVCFSLLCDNDAFKVSWHQTKPAFYWNSLPAENYILLFLSLIFNFFLLIF